MDQEITDHSVLLTLITCRVTEQKIVRCGLIPAETFGSSVVQTTVTAVTTATYGITMFLPMSGLWLRGQAVQISVERMAHREFPTLQIFLPDFGEAQDGLI